MQGLRRRGTGAVTALALLITGALIAGCGGGSGGGSGAGVSPQTVSGVAATGAPLAGQVSLRDSSSTRKESSTVISSDGSFAIDVSDMKAPFILKASGIADGVNRTMYSFADKPGTANINPLSTVAVANAAGVDDPATVFDKPDAQTLDKIKSGMPGSVSTLKSKLKVLLDGFSVANADPVSDPFSADHTGLDGMFDNVKIVLAGGTLTITNASTGAVIFTAQVREVASGHFTDNGDDVPKAGPRPAAPTGVKAVGGDAQVTVSWDPVANATSYDLFYSTKANVATEEDNNDAEAKRVKNVTSPFVLKGLRASTSYSFIVRAISNGRRGSASAEVSATTSGTTPTATIPAAPTGLSATGGTKQTTVSWTAVTGATSYNLYWSTTTGVTTANGTKISGVTSPAVHTGLANSTAYYYIVTAQNSAGESAASVQIAATTLSGTVATTAPNAPAGVTATGGAAQVNLAWPAVTGADAYNVYWSNTSGVTTSTGTKIAGVTSPFVQTGLNASTAYFYVVTAVNSAGESGPSIQVNATTDAPAATVPAAPTGVTATGGAKQVSVAWTAVSGATSYNLYWSSTTGVTTATGTKVTGASRPSVQTGLADNTVYFFIVTAVNGNGESAASGEATATTSAAALDGVALYNANCSSCHGANGKKPRTAQQITDAIANVGAMQGISLTQAQIAAIAARP